MEHIPGTMMLLTVKNSDEFLREVKSLGGYKQAIDAWLSEMNKQFEPYNFKVKYQQFAEDLHISCIDYDKHPFVYNGDTRTSHRIISTAQDVYEFRECAPTLVDLMQLVKDHPEMFKRVKLDIPNSCVTIEMCTSIGKVRTEMTIMASLDTFVHESETQNVNELLTQLDVVDICSVDFASYGIVTHETGTKWSLENWQDKLWQTSNKYTDGYVTKTNCGDGAFLLYTNENHSVFMLDDEDVYLNTLTNEQGIADFGWLSAFAIKNGSVNVTYHPKGCGIKYEREQKNVEPGERYIDAIVRLMVQICNKNGYTPFPRVRN